MHLAKAFNTKHLVVLFTIILCLGLGTVLTLNGFSVPLLHCSDVIDNEINFIFQFVLQLALQLILIGSATNLFL